MTTSPRLTEERLRYHLDSNQVMRERLCLAILPMMGPYTREKPRRPKGGPDGGRDIEAIYEGTIQAWDAIGFRNGGGNDEAARRDMQQKFRLDLERALSENPALKVFFFFTNVDFTPSIIEDLKRSSSLKGVDITEIFDIEQLRHALDSPEGLIARLQYLDIPMSETEQIALVSKFGSQLQKAILDRFDRVEQTLSEMSEFLAFQKPLHRFDLSVILTNRFSSIEIGNEAILFDIEGVHDLRKHVYFLCVNNTIHALSSEYLVTSSYLWLGEGQKKMAQFDTSLGLTKSMISVYGILSLTTGGHRVRLADLTVLSLKVFCTSGFKELINRVAVDINGYEIFGFSPDSFVKEDVVEIHNEVPFDTSSKKWFSVTPILTRDLTKDPLKPSVHLNH